MYLHVIKPLHEWKVSCSLGLAAAVPAQRLMLHSVTMLNNDVIGKKVAATTDVI